MEDFAGINTSTTRPGVADEQMFWCDGWMPIGKRQLRVLPGMGPAGFTATTSGVVFFDFANIGPIAVMIVILSDGSIVEVQTAIGTTTTIAPPGTIINPSQLTVGISQWGSQFVLIVSQQTNGYFIWDGTLLYQAGSLAATTVLTDNGVGYTSIPTVTAFGGSGSGATFTANVDFNAQIVTSASVTNPGAGYSSNDVVGLAFSGGGSGGSTAILQAFVSGGSLSTVSIITAGTGYTAAAHADIQGGGGTGASLTLTASGGSITVASLAAAGTGYLTAPTVLTLDASNPVAKGTASLMPFGVSGTSIEVYSGRVWISDGPFVTFTAAGSLTDFSTSNGGGNFTSVDSFLRVGYTQLKQSSGFLYLIADSSINYISAVQTTGSPPTTTYTNQNADPETGTVWPGTVDVFGRNIVFANAFGAHILYGAAATKISEVLDGVYASVPNFGGLTPSGAKAIIFGKKVWILLLPIIDPLSGLQVNKLFLWNGKLWWSSSQDVELTFIQHQEINSVITAWGTNGVTIAPLFSQPSTAFTKTVQSKFWDAPIGYQFIKAPSRFWAMFYVPQIEAPVTIDVEIDSETTTSSYSFTSGRNSIPVINASNIVIPCINASNVTIPVFSIAAPYFILPPTAIGETGVVNGFTISTDDGDLSLISAMMEAGVVQYRG
jgi:hypothetical protein